MNLGPFSHANMQEWYKHGYFMDPKLLLRRACQAEFYPLKELVIQSSFTGDVTPFVYIPPTKKKMNVSISMPLGF